MSHLTSDDLQELLNDGAVENARLEFKSEVPAKEETLKKLSSFANTFGGFMVVGAKANSSDGRIEDLSGVDAQSGYKQKVVQWSFDAVSPPLVVEVSDPILSPSGNGKVCYVVYTAESDVAPHFLNGRKGVWVRTDEFSSRFEARLANETEVRHLFDRRKSIRDRRDFLVGRAQRRFETFLKRRNLSDNQLITNSLLTLSVIPRFPSHQLCAQENLEAFLLNRNVYRNWRQVLFPRVTGPRIFQYESIIVPDGAGGTSFLEINVWGLIFYGVQIDRDDVENSGIYLGQFVGLCLASIEHCGKLLHIMGYSGPLHIETTLSSIRDVLWMGSDNYGSVISHGRSEFDDHVSFLTPKSSEDLFDKPDGVAIDILQNVFFSVNSSHLVDTKQKREDLIRQGYVYNMWPAPSSLRI